MDPHACLNGAIIPEAGADCNYCAYIEAVSNYL